MRDDQKLDARRAATQLLNQLRDDRLAIFQKLTLIPLFYYAYRAFAVGMYVAFYALLVGIANNLFNIWLLKQPTGRRWAAPLYVSGFYLLFPGIACFDDFLDSPSLWFLCGGPIIASLTMGARAVKINLYACLIVILGVTIGEFTVHDLPVREHPEKAIWTMRLFVLFVLSGFGLIAAWRSHKLSREIQSKNKELESARAKAQAAAASKSDFLATMSHEIRTPMNGILGTAQHLLGSDLSEDETGYSRIVLDAGHQLMDVLNAILDLSKIEAQQFALRDAELRLDRIFKDVCNEVAGSVESQPVQLKVIPISLPTVLQGDPSRIEQVLRNLLMTMVSLGNHAVVEVELIQEKRLACIEFRVPGVCLENEARAILEEPKSALTNQPNQSQRLALVMSVSREIIELMGGALVVHADEEKGSVVRWFFYRGAKKQERELSVSSATADQVSVALHPAHDVLVVDDNAINRRVARMQLEQLGCKVSLAQDGEQAVAMSQQSSFSVIFMDLSMPKLDGRQATKKIRNQKGPNTHTPIIAFTADAYDANLDSLQALGMNGHLAKPFRVAALTRLLNELGLEETQQSRKANRA